MSRTAYALEQLVDEVKAIDNTIEVKLGDPDGFDVVREALFKTGNKTKASKVKLENIGRALTLGSENRVASTESDDGWLIVTLQASNVADDRKSFNLAGAVEVLTEDGKDEKAEDENPPQS